MNQVIPGIKLGKVILTGIGEYNIHFHQKQFLRKTVISSWNAYKQYQCQYG